MGRKPIRSGGKAIEIKERKALAVKLRRDGLSLQEIADEMNLDQSTIYYYIQDVSKSIEESSKKDLTALRETQLERLEAYAYTIHEILLNPAGDTPYQKQRQTLNAIEKGLKVMERLARLNGLDMPTKIEQTGNTVTFVMDMSGADEPSDSTV